jgi:thiamine pyrophosphate-dependent acetolactate synthase large subunit-like protein
MTADDALGAAAGAPGWGSDVVADLLRATGVPYIALNPGASFRGLHDSLVNHLGGDRPRMLMCLHEEHAVALAHGYAKVTGEPLAVALHSNVGLMHASMAIYNAWADRVPVLIVGATGPVDAAKRRPWIDWIHTAADQAALVRPFVKWDDQPMSVEATAEALARAWDVTRTPPQAPTYVVLDAAVQEQRLTGPVNPPAVTAGPVRDVPAASPESVRRAVEVLDAAQRPVVLMGRVSRGVDDWHRRVRLVEALGARVVTDLKAGAAFPTRHPAHVPGPSFFLSEPGRDALAEADAVLSLDWVDLAGTLAQARTEQRRQVVSVGLDHHLHNGWSKDHQGRVHADVTLPTTPDIAVKQLLSELGDRTPAAGTRRSPEPSTTAATGEAAATDDTVRLTDLARELRTAVTGTPTCLVRLPLGWDGDDWDFEHPLDYLGYDGGGGIGSGPGMLVGAALALKGPDRLPVGVLGDGDYLMGVQALWTAAHDEVPLLAVVSNNRSYFNDEVHQERVARVRGRDESRRWVGQRIDDPAPDLAALARAQGLEGIGPITKAGDLPDALRSAVALVRAGRPVVVDVVVEPGYTPAMSSGVVREG